jgi:hypothetical protein
MGGVREVPLETLLGRLVRDQDGRPCGRIEEVVGRWRGDTCLVEEFHLGPHALLERLAASAPLRPLLAPFGRARPSLRRVRWDRLDLNDPSRPRLHP